MKHTLSPPCRLACHDGKNIKVNGVFSHQARRFKRLSEGADAPGCFTVAVMRCFITVERKPHQKAAVFQKAAPFGVNKQAVCLNRIRNRQFLC